MVIDHGAKIAEDSPAGLITREIEPNVVEVTGDGLANWAAQARAQGLAGRIELVGETAFAYCREPARLVASLQAQPLLHYLLRRANLEDVFLKVTGRDLRD
jgi:lipooligosaccharide transport system ATP-binding protein